MMNWLEHNYMVFVRFNHNFTFGSFSIYKTFCGIFSLDAKSRNVLSNQFRKMMCHESYTDVQKLQSKLPLKQGQDHSVIYGRLENGIGT